MPSNSYCSQCQNMQSEMDLDKDRWIDLVFSKASAHYCAVGIFFRIGQLVIVFAVLFVIHSSDTHRPLFIEWHRQASYVLLLINVFCKCIMVHKALAFNIHLCYPFDSSGLYPFLERKGKGRLFIVTPQIVEEGVGYRSKPGRSFPCPAAYRLMIKRFRYMEYFLSLLHKFWVWSKGYWELSSR